MQTFVDSSKLFEYRPGLFNAEASELGWKPGFWPEQVNTNLGNGLPLGITRLDEYAAQYKQTGGCVELLVFND